MTTTVAGIGALFANDYDEFDAILVRVDCARPGEPLPCFKEENILYPACETILTGAAADVLLSHFRADPSH